MNWSKYFQRKARIENGIILGILVIVLAIGWDESRAGTIEEVHPICQSYGEFTYVVAEARDAGLPQSEALSAVEGQEQVLIEIVKFVYENADADALTVAREVYRSCMSELVTE